MIIYFGDTQNNFGISKLQVLCSLLFTLANLATQIWLLYDESQSVRMETLDYTVTCFTGSTGTAPLLNKINIENRETYHELDYSAIEKYRFDDITIIPLRDILREIEETEKEAERLPI